MDNREIIIKRAHSLLSSIGPTSMTMDMVARACGISKRTLYETFPDKKTVIMECIGAEHAQHQAKACKIFSESSNCFEAMFKLFQLTRRYENKQKQAIIDEIMRLYPDVIECQRQGERTFIANLDKVLKQAQAEGLVMDIVNTGIAAFMFFTLNRSLHKSPDIEAMGYERSKVFEAAFVNFLRGIATHKGREVIDTEARKHFNSDK